MRRLVQLAIHIWLHKEDRTAAAWADAIRHVLSVFKQMPVPDHHGPRWWRETLPHAQLVLRETKKDPSPERTGLLEDVAYCLMMDGRRQEESQLREEICSRLSHLPEDDHQLLNERWYLARAYTYSGKDGLATSLFEKCVSISLRTYDAHDPPIVLDFQEALASSSLTLGKVSAAMELLTHVYNVLKRGSDKGEMLKWTLTVIAEAYLESHDY